MDNIHISDAELIGFSDCEVDAVRTTAIQAHLKSCAECRARWGTLSSAAHAYEQFHEEVLKPALAFPQSQWPDLRLAEVVTPRRNFFASPWVWWGVAASVACVVLAAVLFNSTFLSNRMEQRQMNQLLARASAIPSPLHRNIRVSAGGQSWLRPALLSNESRHAQVQRVEALFVQANYSWENPLSARSFASWRGQLREKRDHVTAVEGTDGLKLLYRVRTETRDGTLRVASLTLRSDDLAAIGGAFEFENHERVTMADAGQDSDTTISKAPAVPATEKERTPQTAEHAVSAADELRVFAALDQIGADVDEPVNVGIDAKKQQVVVSAMGLPRTREQQIREALAAIPNAVTHFDSAPAPTSSAQSAGPNADLPANNPGLRSLLEQRAGGAASFQALTDRALEASNTVFAQAHALAVLAQRFSPDVEANLSEADRDLLTKLRQRHATAIEQNASGLEAALKPLLSIAATDGGRYAETGVPPHASWQTGARELLGRARALDQSVTNLLGANYSDAMARDVINRLPKSLQETEALANWQAHAE